MLGLFFIIIGLIICFYSIYFQKVIQAITGFISGLLLGLIINWMFMLSAGESSLLTLVMLSDEDTARFYIVMLVMAFIFSFLSIKLEGLIWAIQTSMFVFVSVCFIFCLFVDMALGDMIGWMIFIAFIISVIAAWAMFIYYRYAFIIMTAFYGGLLAAIGFVYLINGGDLYRLLNGKTEHSALLFVITAILTCCGFIHQKKILLRIEAEGLSIPKLSNSEKQNSSTHAKFSMAQALGKGSFVAELFDNKICAILILCGLVIEPVLREYGPYIYYNQYYLYMLVEMMGLAAFVYIGFNCRDIVLFVYAMPYFVIAIINRISFFAYNATYAFTSIVYIIAISLIVWATKKYIHSNLQYLVAGYGTILYRFVIEHLIQLCNGYGEWWRPSAYEVVCDIVFLVVYAVLVYKFEGIKLWNITAFAENGKTFVVGMIGIAAAIGLCIVGSEGYRYIKLHKVNRPEPFGRGVTDNMMNVTEREELFLRSVLGAIDFRGEWKSFDDPAELSDGDRIDALLNAKDIDLYIDDTECFMPTASQETNYTIKHKDLEEASETIWGIQYDKDSAYDDLSEKYDYGSIASGNEGLYKVSPYIGECKDEIDIVDILYNENEITIDYTEYFYYTDGELYIWLDREATVLRTDSKEYPFSIKSVQLVNASFYESYNVAEGNPEDETGSEWKTVYDATGYTAAIDQGLVGSWIVSYYEDEDDENETEMWYVELYDDYTGMKKYDGEEYPFTWKTEGDFELTFHHPETGYDERYCNCVLVEKDLFVTYPAYGGYCKYFKYY